MVQPACKAVAVAATEPGLRNAIRGLLRQVLARWRSLLGTAVAGGAAAQAGAAVLPEDRAEAVFHVYDGGGVKADGPAVLLRKSLGDRVSVAAQYYVDAVSNASIDVVTTASPFKETRTAWDASADWLVREALLTLSYSKSTEPDYIAEGVGLDGSVEVYGGMTTVSLGFTRSRDLVGDKRVQGWIDQATHWQWRAGVTQILTRGWLVSLNAEQISDEGFLGSPYRAARVFGAAVPERMPRTRTGRALKLRSINDTSALVPRSSFRAEARWYGDSWDVKATTYEFGVAKHLGSRFIVEALVRRHSQDKALFYSDDAQLETQYVSRNRQLSTFSTTGVGAKLTWTLPNPALLPPGSALNLTGSFERKQFRFADFTDSRSGERYAYDANVFQIVVSGSF